MGKIKKFIKYFLLIIGLFVIITAGFYLWQSNAWKRGINFSCVKIEEHNVSGQSMEPLILDGAKAMGLTGYYNCNDARRGDIVILKFQTREETFIKKIAGLPGDLLEFDGDKLKINGEILKNSAGEAYLFSSASQRIITIPLENGRIAQGRYFIMSDEKGPSAFDSRQFGFVEKEILKGRAIIK
jgi:signal peptidase I